MQAGTTRHLTTWIRQVSERSWLTASDMTAQPPPDSAPPRATKHTAIGVGLNLLLLTMIAYGYWRSDDWKWTWVLVGIPITVVTLRYAWHLVRWRS